MKEIEQIRSLSILKLKEKLKIQIKSYKKMKINHGISPLQNSSLIVKSRRWIARLKTEICLKEVGNNIVENKNDK